MSGECPSEGSMPNKRLKKRSEVWEHFDETPDGQRAICKYCANSLNGNSKDGTSHLKRHLKSCKKCPQGGVCPPPTLVIRNEAINTGLIWVKTWEDLVKKAIKKEIPFASSECRELWHNVVGPMDVEKEIFTYYEHAKEKLAIELKELTSRVSFSVEVLQEVGYMSIMAHFIDRDFNLIRKLIGFKKLSNVHSSACIVDAIKSCISEWNLGDKIFTFIKGKFASDLKENLLENFSSKMLLNGKYVTESCFKEKLRQLWYFCLNHFCEGLTMEKFVDALKTVLIRLAAFNEIAEIKGLNPVNKDWLNEYRGICWYSDDDVERCNLAAKMFKEVIIYKDVFRQIVGLPTLEHEGDSESDNLGPNQLGNANSSSTDACTGAGQPSLSEPNLCTIDWNAVEPALKISDLCSAIIDGLSSFNHPTLSLCFPYIAELDKLISELDRDFLCSIFECFESNLFEIANALDPRYKLIFSDYYWTKIIYCPYGDLDEQIEEVFCAYEKEESKDASLVCLEHTNREHQVSSSKSAILSPQTIDEFSKYVREIKNTKKSELDKYLDDELVDLDDATFNILGWWKENRLQYPILSKMARDILAVPASVFSTRGIISSDFEAFEGLNPELVEAVVCSKDWILSDEQSMPESNGGSSMVLLALK